MARQRKNISLNVFLNGRLVGFLSRQASGAIDFKYDASWLEWENSLPVSLSLPLRDAQFSGAAVNAVFDNLLPDNYDIRRRLAMRAKAEGDDAYSLLAAVGRDCVGALQFLPIDIAIEPAGKLFGRSVDEAEIAEILNDLSNNPLGISSDKEFRISIAGAQEKTALLYWKNKWHVPHGTTATTHILKPAIGKLPNGMDLSNSVENEYFCMKLTKALGLPAANVEIQDFNGKRVLVIERFDRLWTKDKRLLRLPQEDLCQALSSPPSLKYEPDGGPGIKEIIKLLQASDTPETDRRMFFKAQIVFWLLGATDGHAKNFSIYLLPGGRFKLTPLYDIMSAQPYVDNNQLQKNKMKLAMAVGDKRHYDIYSVLPRHFMQTAAACGLPGSLIEEIFTELKERASGAIAETMAALPRNFPAKMAKSIIDGVMARLQL